MQQKAELVEQNILRSELEAKVQKEKAKLFLVKPDSQLPQAATQVELEQVPLFSRNFKVGAYLSICGLAYFCASLIPAANGLHVILIPLQVASAYGLGWVAAKGK